MDICILDYNEHALSVGSHAKAAAYINMWDKESDKKTYGVGISSNITKASIRAIFSALNRITALNEQI
jgi:2-isopropylmalate synthase